MTNFRQLLNPLLSPSNSSCLDIPGEACFEAELHARALAENFTRINSTRPALERAQDFLAGLRDLPNINFASLNRTALDAITIGNEALEKLGASNSSDILRRAMGERDSSQQLSNEVSGLVEGAERELASAQRQFNRSLRQRERFEQLVNTVAAVNQTVRELEQTPDLAEEARRLNMTAGGIGVRVRDSRLRVDEIERRLPALEEEVMNLTSAVLEADRLLNRTGNICKCPLTQFISMSVLSCHPPSCSSLPALSSQSHRSRRRSQLLHL